MIVSLISGCKYSSVYMGTKSCIFHFPWYATGMMYSSSATLVVIARGIDMSLFAQKKASNISPHVMQDAKPESTQQ